MRFSNNVQFWSLNAAGWFLYLLFSGVFFSLLSGEFAIGFVIINLIGWFYYVPACGALRVLLKRTGWLDQRQPVFTYVGLALIIACMCLLGQFLVSLYMMHVMHIMTWDNYSWPTLFITVFQRWVIVCVWVLLYYAIKQIRHSREQQLRQVQLESTLRKTELQALKAQLNPHFIFNCLNNIRALALEDAGATRQSITHLSEMLKYSFQFDELAQMPLKREIQHVKNYLALEQIQFEKRLRSQIDVAPGLGEHLIPTLCIQLLVENAIKHGIMHAPDGGEIHIRVKSQANKLIISVNNTGQLLADAREGGIGLTNLKQRLTLLYGHQAQFKLTQADTNTVSAQITLPMEGPHV